MGENNTVMQVKFDRFFARLKKTGLTQKEFKENVGIGGTTFKKILNNESITTSTICKICDYFHCMPEDIMEWIPEPKKTNETEKKKAELQSQIAELQAKLEKL